MEKQCGKNPALHSSSSMGGTDRSNSQNGTQQHQSQQQHVGGGESSSASIDHHPSAVDILARIERSSTVDNNSTTPMKKKGGKELKSSTCQPVANGEKKESPTLGNNNSSDGSPTLVSSQDSGNSSGQINVDSTMVGEGGGITKSNPNLDETPNGSNENNAAKQVGEDVSMESVELAKVATKPNKKNDQTTVEGGTKPSSETKDESATLGKVVKDAATSKDEEGGICKEGGGVNDTAKQPSTMMISRGKSFDLLSTIKSDVERNKASDVVEPSTQPKESFNNGIAGGGGALRGKVLPELEKLEASHTLLDIAGDNAKVPTANDRRISSRRGALRGKVLLPPTNDYVASSTSKTEDVKVDESTATNDSPPTTRLRGKVLAKTRHTVVDEVEHATIVKPKMNETLEIDAKGNRIELSQNDIVLSFKNPAYKAFMFARFREMNSNEGTKSVSNEVFQIFKDRGGRFFKLQPHKTHYKEVGDEEAFKKIQRDFTCGRSETENQWNASYFAPKKEGVVTHGSTNPSRKRTKPENFMDAQSKDFEVQEKLRKESAAAKKKKKRNPGQTKQFIDKEYNSTRAGSTERDEKLEGGGAAAATDGARKSGRTRVGTWKTKEITPDTPQSTSPKGSKSNETKTPRKSNRSMAPKRSRESEHDAAGHNGSGRPKRQAAMNRKKMYGVSSSGDDSSAASSRKSATSSHKSATRPPKMNLKREKTALLKKLSNIPSSVYEEESAWRFYNPGFVKDSSEQLTALRGKFDIPHSPANVAAEELQPLPPAMPLPQLPNTSYCKWSFDEKSRVLLANFRESSYAANKDGKIKVGREDEEFLFKMMERDDITVISEGLADLINSSLWTREYIEGCIGSEYHHKFRRFETKHLQGHPATQPTEKEGWYSMKVSDYFDYLEKRHSVKSSALNGAEEEQRDVSKDFTFIDSGGREKTVNVDNESLYMIDVDLVKLLPQAFEDFQNSFKLPGILPGGSHCMMNAVNANGRPFMGPNLYITPPSSFTHFHQDGHGTVDSGHLCLSGYNEVVMLRRLTERHKCHAIKILTGTSDSYGALYGLPHRDGLESNLGWPTNDAVGKCKDMGYYPSVFVLKPGQVVHINKGRLHAFRKLAPQALNKTDCHHDLRNEVLQTKENGQQEDLCFSIAWDWMFKGVTSNGINREVSSILECSKLNREHELASLAIPETALLFLAKENIAKHQLEARASAGNSLFAMNIPSYSPRGGNAEPDATTVLRGILPSLQYVVNRHNESVKFSKKWEKQTRNTLDSWKVSIDSKPNTWQDPGTFALDPYGSSDFFCKFCSEELSNVYMHCDGCERLLNKDFNICSTCHMEGKYQVKVQMHPFNDKPHSIHNHTGNAQYLRQSRCPCKNGKACRYCSYCTGCSCRCHQWFTLHYRFMEPGNELDILQKAENIVGSDVIPHTVETKVRLLSLISEDLPQVDMMPSGGDAICQVIEVPKKSLTKNEKTTIDMQPEGVKSKYSTSDVICPPIDDSKPAARTGGRKKKVPQPAKGPAVAKAKGPPSDGEEVGGIGSFKNGSSQRPPKPPRRPPNITLPPGENTVSTPAPEIGPGWLQQRTRRKTASGVSNNRSDLCYISPDGKKCSWAEVENRFKKLGAEKDGKVAGKLAVTSSADAQTARAEFAEHVNNCGQEMNGNNAKASRRMRARGDSTSSLSTSNTLGGQASLNETLSEEVSYVFNKNETSLNELEVGQRVLVRCDQGQNWHAKILGRNEKKGVPGYNIHYKGSKRKEKSRQDWVSADKIVAFQDMDNE